MLQAAMFKGQLVQSTAELAAINSLGLRGNEQEMAIDTIRNALDDGIRTQKSNILKGSPREAYSALVLGDAKDTLEAYCYDKIFKIGVLQATGKDGGFAVYTERMRNIKETLAIMFGASDGLGGDNSSNNAALEGIFKRQLGNRLIYLGDKGMGGTWKGVTSAYISEAVDSDYGETWEYLHHGFAMYYVEGATDANSMYRLITKSEMLLKCLLSFNMLCTETDGSCDLQGVLSRLNPASDKKNLIDGTTAVARLNWQPSLHKYVVTVSSKCDMSKMYMLPLLEAEGNFITILSGVQTSSNLPYLNVRCRYAGDDKDTNLKCVADVVSYYGWYQDVKDAETRHKLEERVNKTVIGFDPNSMRTRLFNIEASIHGKLTSSIVPGTSLVIGQGVNPRNVNISCHDIDYSLLSLVFHSKVARMTKADFEAISKVMSFDAPTVRAKKQEILQWQSNLAPDELYRLLTYPDEGVWKVFGTDIKAALAKRKNYLPVYLKNFQAITKAEIEARAKAENKAIEEVLSDIMSKGVLHATVFGASGSMRETYITTNEQILKAVHGQRYLALYGSRRSRLLALKQELDGIKTYDELVDTLKEYGLEDVTAWKIYEMYSKTFNNLSKITNIPVEFGKLIDAEVMKLAERDISSIKMVTGMKVLGYSFVRSNGVISLYDSFNISNIVSLEYTVKK